MESFLTNVNQYWEEVKDQYDIDFNEFKKVCKTPFKFVKEVISSGILRNIRLKYLGVFEVSKSRVNFSKKTLEKNYSKGVVSEEKYIKKLKILESYQPPELFKACEADILQPICEKIGEYGIVRRGTKIIKNNECK